MFRAVSGSNTEEVLQSRGIRTVSKSRFCSLVVMFITEKKTITKRQTLINK